MKKIIAILGILVLANVANNPIVIAGDYLNTTNIHSQISSPFDEPRGNIYRSDGFRPGVLSEWIQVAFNEDLSEVEGIWYWNSDDDTKIPFKIVNQEGVEGEISGIVGEMMMYGSDNIYEFGIIEDRFNLKNDDSFQEFEYESTE